MISRICINLINIYQFFSLDRGLLKTLVPGGACKYDPSCSEYTKIAISQFGVKRGILLGVKRIISCR